MRPSSLLFFSKEGFFFLRSLTQHNIFGQFFLSPHLLDLLIILIFTTFGATWEHILFLLFLWTPSSLSALFPCSDGLVPRAQSSELLLLCCFDLWQSLVLICTSPLQMLHFSKSQRGKTQTYFTPLTVLLPTLPVLGSSPTILCLQLYLLFVLPEISH